MKEAEGYDVLRLIEHGRGCYISSDYVEGTSLIRQLKYHPNLSKGQLFLWIHEMARQLECIHKCRGNPCYRYVNPYSIIITKEKELHFLDVGADANEAVLSVMRRRSVREYFLPPGEAYYQTESISLDIYGLGKTIQYLLSESEPVPGLTKREEIRFQNIVSKCLHEHGKKTYQSVSELRKQIPTYHVTRKIITKMRFFLMVTALSVVTAGVFLQHNASEVNSMADMLPEAGDYSNRKEEETWLNETEEEKVIKTHTEQEDISASGLQETLEVQKNNSALKKELGFIYFLDKRDYRKSREYFVENMEDEKSQQLARLSEYMLMGDITGKEKELEMLLHELEKDIPEMLQERFYRCLLRGYGLLDSIAAADEVIHLGEEIIDDADEEAVQEITASVAAAYEITGNRTKAIEKYTEILVWEKDDGSREKIYEKLAVLFRDNGEPDRAEVICRQGVEEQKDSIKLRLLHIRLLCGDEKVKRSLCARAIKEYIEEIPEIKEEKEFKELVKEYDIIEKGEKICVGK